MAWGLPTAALDHRSRLARISAAGGLVLLMTYEVLRHPISRGDVVYQAALVGGPLVDGGPDHRPALDARPRTDKEQHHDRTRRTVRTAVRRPDGRRAHARHHPDAQRGAQHRDGAAPRPPRGARRRTSSSSTTAATTAPPRSSSGSRPRRRASIQLAAADRSGRARPRVPVRVPPRAGRRATTILVEMDADLSHDPGDLPALIDAVDARRRPRDRLPLRRRWHHRRVAQAPRGALPGRRLVRAAPPRLAGARHHVGVTARTAPSCCGRSTSSRSRRRATGSRSR